MKKLIMLFISCLITISMNSCFQFSMIIQVNPDGSGTIHQTILLKKSLI